MKVRNYKWVTGIGVSVLGLCLSLIVIFSAVNNVALGAGTSASSENAGNLASYAVDGNMGTRWESNWNDNEWLQVDLGVTKIIDSVDIYWETAAGQNFTIDTSVDGQTWATGATITNGTGGHQSITLPVVSARYVRMNGQTRTTQYGFSIFEFEVYEASTTPQPANPFGDNVYIFSPDQQQSEIQGVIDGVYATSETDQFGTDRYAFLFKPGDYPDVNVKVGFYTQVSGLGTLPTQTSVGEFNCLADWMDANSTCNFWRRAENLEVDETATWAAAQATSLRRMHFENWVGLDQWGQGWASGGFVADSKVDGTAAAYSQQQYLSRNSDYGNWSGGVWNAVFVGMKDGLTVQGTSTVVEDNWASEPGYEYFTVVDESPVLREMPYLTIDANGNYSVFRPALKYNSEGTSWANGQEAGTSIPLNQFYIAHSDTDTAASINQQLASGKHLLLTPGIYHLEGAIQVNNPNTVVLGMGLATLTPTGLFPCMEVADVDGVTVAGLLFDAGPSYTDTLLQVGNTNASANHSANPTLLSDLFFRVGGATSGVTQSRTCIIINSNHVIGDNFWVWRADHGDGVAWNLNETENGIIINGDYVTMYGLFVEHFHEYQTVWNGNYGELYFYQSEIPYDVPNQSSWMSHNQTMNGYASYKVGDQVTHHDAYGLGIYSYHRDATIDLFQAAEVPDTSNVNIHHICTVMLAGNPGISHVINGTGGAVSIAGERQQIVDYSGQSTPVSNVALNKTATSSTVIGANVPGAAVDGNEATRWESAFADNQWLEVDLGQSYSINGVDIVWEAAAGLNYDIEVSLDGQQWTSVVSQTNGVGGTESYTFNSTSARYVRMNGHTRTTPYGFSIFELKVYGQ